jgi:hypothetical protein
MIVSDIYDHLARLRSFELIADVTGITPYWRSPPTDPASNRGLTALLPGWVAKDGGSLLH